MRTLVINGLLAGTAILAVVALGQEGPGADPASTQRPTSYKNMTPEQRAAATREFLGLGAKPDKDAAARGAPLFQRNCSFCHGPQARGATGPSLITSDVVLSDDHGEHLAPYVKQGRPDKGMPSFANMPEQKLTDMAEFLHLQVEEIANRGAYHVLNILVGDKAKGQAYVGTHCLSCHSAEVFAHVGSRFRSPEQLQRNWIWPSRGNDPKLAVTATVKRPDGSIITERVSQMSDFCVTLLDETGKKLVIERRPGVELEIHDPLAAHEHMILSLTNEDMHNVTAYLESLK